MACRVRGRWDRGGGAVSGVEYLSKRWGQYEDGRAYSTQKDRRIDKPDEGCTIAFAVEGSKMQEGGSGMDLSGDYGCAVDQVGVQHFKHLKCLAKDMVRTVASKTEYEGTLRYSYCSTLPVQYCTPAVLDKNFDAVARTGA